MSQSKYDALKLENQLCFPLYAAAREVLKCLETKGYVVRKRSTTDERSVSVYLTDSGEALKERAVEVPAKVAGCVGLEPEEAIQLYGLLYKILDTDKED